MRLAIAGMGWITPLGNGLDSVWQRLLRGDEPHPEKVTDQLGDRAYTVFRVPESALAGLEPHPRLRRASLISRFAAAAGLEALHVAGVKPDPQHPKRFALVFAISNGGVIYTRRFYRDIVDAGPQSASPLLFPETVFNAPASHLAAILGITGATYTVVGDSAVGILAIKMAEDLMANEGLDYCLIVGAEEADWLLCDAYHRWRLLRSEVPVQPFSERNHGMILSEGAGAILLARRPRGNEREASVEIESIHSGGYYRKRREAAEILNRVLRDLKEHEIDLVVSSANGTFIDNAECRALKQLLPNAAVYTPKAVFGESVGAAGLWQVIAGAQALRCGELPAVLHAGATIPLRVLRSRSSISDARRAIVVGCGLNQQVAALRLAKCF